MEENIVILVGNLTRDVELRHTPKGDAVATFGMAHNRTWKDEAGQIKKVVTYVDVKLWQKKAEVAAQYLRKGSPVYIRGTLEMEQWKDKETGVPRSKLLIRADKLGLIDSRERDDRDDRENSPPPASRHPGSDSGDGDKNSDTGGDDNVPF